MRFRFHPSIAHTIFALAGLLIVLMGIVAAINTAMSLRVGDLIGSLNRTYVPVYGMLARAQIRSLEQSLALRQAALATLAIPPEPSKDFLEAEAKAREAADAELEQARAAIAAQTARVSAIDDRVLLGRIAVQLDDVAHQRAVHAEERADMLKALEARDPAAIRASLDRLDEVRTEQSERMEQARRESLAFASGAVRATQENGQDVIRLTLVTLAFSIMLGALGALWIARRMVGSIRRLLTATEAAGQGQYDAELPVTSRDEIGRLTRSFNLMLAELRLKQKIRDMFGRYMDPKLVSSLIDRPDGMPQAERKIMTVLFADMAGFSRLSEEVNPPLLVSVLNRFLSLLGEPVRATQGVLDKYLGDGIMAFWGPPFAAGQDQARFACEAAWRQATGFAAFHAELPDLIGVRKYVPKVALRIGIATGDVIAGSIGSQTALNYTVMGDAVNLASRLEGLNKVYGTTILVTEPTARMAGSDFLFREIDRVAVSGREEPVVVYELMGPVGASETGDVLCEAYAAGLAAYRNRGWAEALSAFSRCQAARPGDGPSAVLMARAQAFLAAPPPGGWDATWTAPGK